MDEFKSSRVRKRSVKRRQRRTTSEHIAEAVTQNDDKITFTALAPSTITPAENALSSKKKKKGLYAPMGAPSHLRVSVRFDYQPDVCKDFKETGYCGFGDACKFLHDRSDYKAGWQLEKEWSEKQKLRQERIARGEDPDEDPTAKSKNDDDVDKDGLPFACFICRGSFKFPVETLCKHYFCEECALKRMEEDPRCAVCNTQLRGTLNTAHKLVAKLASK